MKDIIKSISHHFSPEAREYRAEKQLEKDTERYYRKMAKHLQKKQLRLDSKNYLDDIPF